MFFNGGVFIIDMLYCAIVDEAFSATNILLIAAVTCELVHCISTQTQSGVRDRAVFSSAFAFRGGVG